MINALVSRLLLRDAEARTRRLTDADRHALAGQLLIARQKLHSAQVLWAHQQYVESLRLAEQSVGEALRAAALAGNVVQTRPEDGSEDTSDDSGLAARVLAELGARPEQIQDALVCEQGLTGARPRLNRELTNQDRAYFRKAAPVAEAVLERLRPLTRAPQEIVLSRRLRIGGLVVMLIACLGLVGMAWRSGDSAKAEQARLHERASRDGFLFREDGTPAIHVVQAGARFLVPSPKEFSALGYKWPNVEVVGGGALAHIGETPAERSLLQERGTATVYLFENGRKRAFTTRESFERAHHWKDVKVVPSGGLERFPLGAPIQ